GSAFGGASSGSAPAAILEAADDLVFDELDVRPRVGTAHDLVLMAPELRFVVVHHDALIDGVVSEVRGRFGGARVGHGLVSGDALLEAAFVLLVVPVVDDASDLVDVRPVAGDGVELDLVLQAPAVADFEREIGGEPGEVPGVDRFLLVGLHGDGRAGGRGCFIGRGVVIAAAGQEDGSQCDAGEGGHTHEVDVTEVSPARI